ncbi:methyltransferase domain-containing protein, partial [Patescibacteria group bacterium]|nr:methyltransferase domain-containing protein [Patescibacteria group bacterium]
LYRNVNPAQDFRNFNLDRLILQYARGGDFLDIGAGEGYLLSLARDGGFQVFGIEPNEDLIQLSRHRYGEMEIAHGGAEQMLPRLSKKFDTAVMADVLEHIEDDAMTLKKLFNVIKPGGRLIIVVPAYPFLFCHSDKAEGHFRRYTRRELKKLVEQSGFRVVAVRYWNMLGLLPHLFFGKILGNNLADIRKRVHGGGKSLLNSFLHFWFSHIENNYNLGFGISIIMVAEKPL